MGHAICLTDHSPLETLSSLLDARFAAMILRSCRLVMQSLVSCNGGSTVLENNVGCSVVTAASGCASLTASALAPAYAARVARCLHPLHDCLSNGVQQEEVLHLCWQTRCWLAAGVRRWSGGQFLCRSGTCSRPSVKSAAELQQGQQGEVHTDVVWLLDVENRC